MRRLTRQQLGPKFSEAARLLWQRCFKSTQDAVAQELDLSPGHLNKLLYGVTRAGTEVAVGIAARCPEIKVALWMAKPAKDFEPPAVVQAKAAAAALEKASKPKRGRRPRSAAASA